MVRHELRGREKGGGSMFSISEDAPGPYGRGVVVGVWEKGRMRMVGDGMIGKGKGGTRLLRAT